MMCSSPIFCRSLRMWTSIVRSLKRTLLDNVEEPLSTLIIEGRVNEGAKVKILPAKAGVTLKVA